MRKRAALQATKAMAKQPKIFKNVSRKQEIMTNVPVELDEHRGMAAQQATEIRRQCIDELHADQEALRRRQEELEKQLIAEPAQTWLEAAAKAQYLIRLYAATPDALDPRRRKIIVGALDDLSRLSNGEQR